MASLRDTIITSLTDYETPLFMSEQGDLYRREAYELIESLGSFPPPFEKAGELLQSLCFKQQTFLSDERELPSQFEQEIICWTSGSSGTPKAVVHTPDSLLASIEGSAQYFDYQEGDVHGLCLPLEHMAGFMILLRALLTGGSVRFLSKEKKNWNKTPLHHLSVVPQQLEDLIALPWNFKSLKSLLLGGGPCSQKIIDRALRQNLPVYPSYGSTEMATTIAVNRKVEGKWMTDILPHRNLELEEGHIVVSGKTLANGHFENESWIPFKGKYATTDLAHWKEELLIIDGRDDDVIVSGGKNISLNSIKILLKDLGVPNPHVIAVESQRYGQRPIAFVDADFLDQVEKYQSQIEKCLAPYAKPDEFLPLPKLEEGKLKWTRQQLEEAWKKTK